MANTDQNTTLRGDVEAAIREVRDHFVSGPVSTPDGGSVVFHAMGVTAHRIAPLDATLPQRVTQAETVVEPASFVDYVNRFKTATTISRASLSRNSIEAVLDYHDKTDGKAGAKPGATTHKATLNCPFDVDYAAWKKKFGEGLGQLEYAEFIEDMLHTIARPAGADLLDAISDLKVDRGIKFKSGLNQSNGTVKLTYEEEDATGGGGSVSIPQEIVIVCPVFQGTEAIQITAKLRYRLDRGAIKFVIAVPGLPKIERDEFRKIGEDIRTSTETPVFYTA